MNPEQEEEILQAVRDENIDKLIEYKDCIDADLLHYAAEHNKFESVYYIVENCNCDVDLNELIYFASYHHNFKMVHYLLYKGADLSKFDVDTIIDTTDELFLRFLLENGADPSGKYNSALIWAINLKNLDNVKCLIEYGADPNKPCCDINLFERANTEHRLDIAAYLFEHGADVSFEHYDRFIEYAVNKYNSWDDLKHLRRLLNPLVLDKIKQLEIEETKVKNYLNLPKDTTDNIMKFL